MDRDPAAVYAADVLVVRRGLVLRPGFLAVDPAGRVSRVGHGEPPASLGRVAAHYALLMPGFIDIHNHGGGGAGSNGGDVLNQWLEPCRVLKHMGEVGTTSCLATVIMPSDSDAVNMSVFHAVNEVVDKTGYGAVLRGIHMEGPVITTPGGLPPSSRYLAKEEFTRLLDAVGQHAKVATVSPTAAAKYGFWHVRELVARGIRPAIGHDTTAKAEDIVSMMKCSDKPLHVTHLFNVSTFHHRNVGICNFGMVKRFPNLPQYVKLTPPSIEVIGDLLHVNPLAIQTLLDQQREDLCFITDSIALHSDKTLNFCGRKLKIANGRVTLAGSCADMLDIYRNLITVFRLTPEQASPMLSEVPAHIAGIGNDVGTLDKGRSCDFVAMDGLDLLAVVVAGKPVSRGSGTASKAN
eukprot:TRINITY_DN5404_c0_g1_i4.p1 TRINITY_DN5404_c0_g1~~TRINITY_DN5404_c0_g1_i4.p1  ORF type:complete len:407 (+),score=101.54 TRINITY_DN5404_c0_g1_i4:48-1268(+)